MTLYLVRHGKATSGIEHLDPGLDEVGKSQAEHVAEALKRYPATRLVCSPLLRARETARPIEAALGLPVEIRSEVSEVFDPSMRIEERGQLLMPLLSGLWSAQSSDLRAWRDRLLQTLIELGKDSKTIVVSHFVAISAAIGASTEDDRVSPCALANASITTLEVQGGKLHLRRAGEVAHLDRDEITATHAVIPGKR
jgi:broad specificity phosphatase PhoE